MAERHGHGAARGGIISSVRADLGGASWRGDGRTGLGCWGRDLSVGRGG